MNIYYIQGPDGAIFKTVSPYTREECVKLPLKQGKELYRLQTIEESKKIIKPGATIYINLTSVSRSGMTRRMKFYVVSENGELISITYRVASILNWAIDEKGVKVDGCGMDMGFHAVSSLSRVLSLGESLSHCYI